MESKVEWGNASVYSLQELGMLSTRFILSVTEELMRDLRWADNETSQWYFTSQWLC